MSEVTHWLNFQEECKRMLEEETGYKYNLIEADVAGITQKSKKQLLDGLFLKHASLENIVLRQSIHN